MKRLVLASGNPGKLRELQALLGGLGLELVPQSALGVEEAEETGLTFVENAILKARNAARQSGLPALADDSGLAVDHLQGAPGIHSSRYAGEGGDAANNAKLLKALAGVPPERRTARFICVAVLLEHAGDPVPLVCEGRWEGRILEAPRGEGGFGYDPLFWVPDQGCASAELPPELKNRISHRGQALRRLRASLEQRLGG
ncbi:MAG: RdgB/HAM1 family non-canonical purine NTP pyrophosphatase [Gammaproteobacteria bacterium]|nr:MAG: RdgB/HAM1 family non-canonical purine NTP pyrophosphatase [Gammaproteobacteria bacterium]